MTLPSKDQVLFKHTVQIKSYQDTTFKTMTRTQSQSCRITFDFFLTSNGSQSNIDIIHKGPYHHCKI